MRGEGTGWCFAGGWVVVGVIRRSCFRSIMYARTERDSDGINGEKRVG